MARLYYGSGTDRRRSEFRDSVTFRTSTVDPSKLVSLGESAKSRNRYWGFAPDSFPVNGRVWYPNASGRRPLVLIVHGNHDMKDFSDPGYGYLGELLASRGFTTVSVDENFLNGGIRSLVAIAPVDGQYLPTGRPTPLTDVNYLVFHGSHDGDVSSFHGLRQYQRVSFTGRLDRFQAGAFRPVATFEEEIDVTTGTMPGVQLKSDSMVSWAEKRLDLRSRNRPAGSASQVNQAAWLGWNHTVAGSDSVGTPGSFRIHLPDSLTRSWAVDSTWTLDFLLAATFDKPGPRPAPRDSMASADSSHVRDQSADSGKADRSRPPEQPTGTDAEKPSGTDDEPIDLTIEITDSSGRVSRLPVSRYGPIRRPLRTSTLRRKKLEKSRLGVDHEIVLQGFTIPLSDLVRESADFDVGHIASIGFVFDRSPIGTVVIDDIGFTRLPSGYLSSRIVPGP